MSKPNLKAVWLDRDTGEIVEGPAPFDPPEDVRANTVPLDYGQAVRMHAGLARRQTQAGQFMREAHRQLADAETTYRKLKAKAIAKARAEWPATVAVDIANGDPEVASAREVYRVAQGLVKAADQIGYMTTKDRAAGEQLVTWSMRVAPLGEFPEHMREDRKGIT